MAVLSCFVIRKSVETNTSACTPLPEAMSTGRQHAAPQQSGGSAPRAELGESSQ
jgi:hypothetical protein